jgi:hypothetical protein
MPVYPMNTYKIYTFPKKDFPDLSSGFGFIFPGPAKIFMVFRTEWEQMAKGIVSSLGILTAGYALALVFAIPIGLYAGWKKRMFNVLPYCKNAVFYPCNSISALFNRASSYIQGIFSVLGIHRSILANPCWLCLWGILGGFPAHQFRTFSRTVGLPDDKKDPAACSTAIDSISDNFPVC